MQVADGEAVDGLAAERTQVDCCDTLRERHVDDEIAGLLVERLKVSGLSVSSFTWTFGRETAGRTLEASPVPPVS